MKLFTLVFSVALPIIGTKTFTANEDVNGLPGEVLDEIIKANGGHVTASVDAVEVADGVELSGQIHLPVVGDEHLSYDVPLTGIAKDIIDELLKLDGGKLTATVTLTEECA